MSTSPPDSPAPERYAALALQIATACVNDCPDRAAARARMAASLERIAASVAASKGFIRQFSGLDESSRALIEDLCAGHIASGGIVVIASHQPFRLHDTRQLDLAEFAA